MFKSIITAFIILLVLLQDALAWDPKCQKVVVIPTGITEVPREAFKGCSELTQVFMPKTMKTIENRAFSGCVNLKDIKMPSTMTKIGPQAFQGCSSLAKVILPTFLNELGDSAFAQCTALEEITIPGSLESVGASAFFECKKLKDVTLSEGVRNILKGAFEATAVIMLEFPYSLRSLGVDAFNFKCYDDLTCGLRWPDGTKWEPRCPLGTSDGTVEVPSGVTFLPAESFSLCKNLQQIIFPDSLLSIGENALFGSGLTELSISDNIEEVRRNACAQCMALTSLYVGKSVKKINQFAFLGSAKLQKIDFHKESQLTEIEVAAFSGCNFGELILPDNLKIIGPDAFSNNLLLSTVKLGNALVTIMGDAFLDSAIKEVTIGPSIMRVGLNAFPKSTKYRWGTEGVLWTPTCGSKTVKVPAGVTLISDDAYSGCKTLASISMPASVRTVGEGAFYNCDSLKQVDLGESVVSIGTLDNSWDNHGTFEGSSLSSIVLPNSVRSIGQRSFTDSLLMKVSLGLGVEEIGWGAFQNTMLEIIKFPRSTKSIDTAAFYNNVYLKYVDFDLASPALDIGDGVFAFTKITSVVVPAVTTYKPTSFNMNVTITRAPPWHPRDSKDSGNGNTSDDGLLYQLGWFSWVAGGAIGCLLGSIITTYVVSRKGIFAGKKKEPMQDGYFQLEERGFGGL